MTTPTEAEAQAFSAAVESLVIEADTLLERVGPREVFAALLAVALDVAADHGVSPCATVRMFSVALSSRLGKTLVLSIRQASPLDDEFDPE